MNRLTDIKNQDSQVIAHYAYDSLSRRTNLSLLNGTSTAYTDDAINRLVAINYQLSTVNYTYDKVGNRLTMTTGGTAPHTYTYDNTYQLTNVTYSDLQSTSYNYDGVGNRLSTVDGGTATYVPNNMNQYDSVGGAVYTYDDNGNLTNTPTSTYTYDYENRLVSYSLAGGEGQGEGAYTYDVFGRRIKKNINGSIATYIHDGDQVICEYDSTGSLTAKYIYGPGIDEPICKLVIASEPSPPHASEAIYYYHFDGLGSVTNITDSTGTVVESYSYDVYGKPNTTSSVGNPYLFTARAYDPETGLYYYRTRYYDARIGRFLQKDRVGFYAGSNLYTYVDNNPVNWIDPLGLFNEGAPGGVFPRGQWPPPSDTTSPNTPPKPPDPTKPDKEKPKKDIPDDPTPEDPTPNEPTGKPRDPADLNGDGKVDNWDWLLWFCVRRFWDLIPGSTGAPYPPGYGDEGPWVNPSYI